MVKHLAISAACLTAICHSQLYGQMDQPWQLILQTGIFSPAEDVIQDVYGHGLMQQVSAASEIGKRGRLKFGANRFNRHGDPFFASRDFDAGDVAQLTLYGVAMSFEMNPLSEVYPRIYLGGGVDYVYGREKIEGQRTNDGGSIGGHLALVAEFKISRKLSFVSEAGYRWLEITFRGGRDRYTFDLSGANLLFGLGYVLGKQ